MQPLLRSLGEVLRKRSKSFWLLTVTVFAVGVYTMFYLQNYSVKVPADDPVVIDNTVLRHLSSHMLQAQIVSGAATALVNDLGPVKCPRAVVDVFSFVDEIELLEIRIGELFKVVDVFIVVEASQTFQGTKRDILWPTLSRRLPREFLLKTRYFHCGALHAKDHWGREGVHRACMQEAMRHYAVMNGDLVIFGDVDEFPSSAAVRRGIELAQGTTNNCTVPVDHSVADAGFPAEMVVRHYNYNFRTIVPIRWVVALWMYHPNVNIHKFAAAKATIDEGGWHCSWCFTNIRRFVEKFKSWSHVERMNRKDLDPEHIKAALCGKVGLFEHSHVVHPTVSLNYEDALRTAPKYLRDHLDKFRYLLPSESTCDLPD
jgi:beta-1,4-mannosyl-glycoprotein beta-1,4-N-acetylglucosaminyltransferase